MKITTEDDNKVEEGNHILDWSRERVSKCLTKNELKYYDSLESERATNIREIFDIFDAE
jgi:hypothetical protein